MFKIGDVVEMTADAAATGMLDFKKGKGYKVEALSYEQEVQRQGRYLITRSFVTLTDESGRTDEYDPGHFKLKEKEDTVVENKECLFKKGQVVWDVIYGEGKVLSIGVYGDMVVEVGFYEDSNLMFTRDYTVDGKVHRNVKRSLFFSEPEIEAATEPMFEPTLKKGDIVAMVSKSSPSSNKYIITVDKEQEDGVVNNSGTWYGKCSWDFYNLGEKINFK